VMLEAASHGVPIVSFDNGGAAEFAAAGHDDDPLAVVVGYLDVAGMAREAARLLADPVARRALARRGRDYVLANHITPVAAPKLFDTLVGLEPRLGPTVEATSAGAPRALR
jgi:glycosyltransferase involved in cell wall biosynthesis